MSKSRFFVKTNAVKQEKINPQLIAKLTSIRLAEYYFPKMNKDFSENDYPDLKVLITVLGGNILETRFDDIDSINIKKAQEKFGNMTENFIANSKDKFSIIVYSAQLLQYYTVICNDDFIPGQNYQEFVKFLADNANKFGDTHKNPFLVEYKLIKIHNDLCELLDKDFEKQLERLLGHLTQLQVVVDDFKRSAPDYVFSQYLDFVTNYIRAKILERNFNVLRNNLVKMTHVEELQHSDAQQCFIQQAQSALTIIHELFDSSSLRNCAHVRGLEYFFGQELFSRFPQQTMETMEKSISMLR